MDKNIIMITQLVNFKVNEINQKKILNSYVEFSYFYGYSHVAFKTNSSWCDVLKGKRRHMLTKKITGQCSLCADSTVLGNAIWNF